MMDQTRLEQLHTSRKVWVAILVGNACLMHGPGLDGTMRVFLRDDEPLTPQLNISHRQNNPTKARAWQIVRRCRHPGLRICQLR